jgi:hypothetical protein
VEVEDITIRLILSIWGDFRAEKSSRAQAGWKTESGV